MTDAILTTFIDRSNTRAGASKTKTWRHPTSRIGPGSNLDRPTQEISSQDAVFQVMMQGLSWLKKHKRRLGTKVSSNLCLREVVPEDAVALAETLVHPLVRSGLRPSGGLPDLANPAAGFDLHFCLDGDAGPIAVAGLAQGWVSYAVSPPLWGRGHGSLILAGLCAKAQEDPGDSPLAAIVLRENRSSIRVLEKSGFEFDGLIQPHRPGPVSSPVMLRYRRLTHNSNESAKLWNA